MATAFAPPFPLVTPQDLADPYPVYRALRMSEPVLRRAPEGPDAAEDVESWYLFRYADVARVMSSSQFGRRAVIWAGQAGRSPGALSELVGNWLVFLDPPRHTRLRSLVTPYFSAAVVDDLRPAIRRISDRLADGLAAGAGEADLVSGFAAPLPVLVICELLGIPAGNQTWLRERALALQEANTSRPGPAGERQVRAEVAARELKDFFLAEIDRRRGYPTLDVISRLVHARGEAGERLTSTEIASTCVHLLTAGHETTTNLIAKGMLALLRDDPTRAELSRNPALMPGAVDELVRYDSPVQMVTRWSYQAESIGGRRVAAGSRVVLVLGSANRDPARFPDPDRLDVHRNAGRHCGFGLGIHYCLGAGLARAEAEIALATLLRRLPGLTLTGEPPDYPPDLVFHGPTRLMVCP